MFCSSTYRYKTHIFLDAVPKTFVKFSGGYFSDTLLGDEHKRVRNIIEEEFEKIEHEDLA